jgi:hypothetical protein
MSDYGRMTVVRTEGVTRSLGNREMVFSQPRVFVAR